MIEQAYQRLVTSGFEAELKHRKTIQCWHDLEQNQWWTPDQVQEMPLQRLSDLLDCCNTNSKWYRELAVGAVHGTKQAHLWVIYLGQATWRYCLKERRYTRHLYRRDMLNRFELWKSKVEDYVERLNRFRPAVLVAYTNPLFLLLRSIEERGIEVHRATLIIDGSEMLHDFERPQIERAFGTPVFETYASHEFTLIGAECDQLCGLHLSSENMIVETVEEIQLTAAGKMQVVIGFDPMVCGDDTKTRIAG